MAKIKRTFNVRVGDTAQMLSLMKKLATLNVDIEAESRPRLVKIVAHGTKEEIRELGSKLKEFTGSER
ncbi:MAG: hypothetical protein QMD95_03235 [Candidatus Hodarchaeaceae archaeon]|nr:hypothetical protein [Candidatus Hodarchaeaceae archaeon]